MKQKEVFNKIGGIIDELSEQYEYLKTVSDDLNDLELELFVANAHFLTDHIEVLCKLNLQNRPKRHLPNEEEVTTFEKKFFEPVVQHVPQEEKKEPELFKPEPPEVAHEEKHYAEPVAKPKEDKPTSSKPEVFTFVPEKDNKDTIRHELMIDESMLSDDEDLPEVTVAPTAPEVSLETPEKPVIKTTDEQPEVANPAPAPIDQTIAPDKEMLTINEKISGQLAERNSAKTEQVSIKPISDLKLAITLNDKLLYVKDLFNGYNLAYSEAIEILNRFNSFEEASRFLKTNYVTKNNWDNKPATVEKFYALLKRRYA